MADSKSKAVQELQSLPFKTLIGAPLAAIIDAQADAARSTVDFIQEVGFEKSDHNADNHFGNTRNISFTYQKLDPSGKNSTATMTMPLLSIVPIPFVRIEATEYEFTAKITDVQETKEEKSTAADGNAVVNTGGLPLPAKVNLKATFGYNNAKKTNASFSAEYGMNIKIRAVQDDLPEGMRKMLMVLENSITDQPAPVTKGGQNS